MDFKKLPTYKTLYKLTYKTPNAKIPQVYFCVLSKHLGPKDISQKTLGLWFMIEFGK
jgi:hypothetical protein